MSMTDEQRQDFEAQCIKIAVEHYGYSSGDAMLKALLERNRNGRYAVEWVQGAALGWVASREAVVVRLPSRPYASEADEEQMTEYEIGIAHGGCEQWDKIHEVIEGQGLKVKL